MTAVYIACSYAARDHAAALARALRGAGHTVTSSWHDGPAETVPEAEMPRDRLAGIWTVNDVDARNAARIVVLGHLGDPSETWCELARFTGAPWGRTHALVYARPGQRIPLTARLCDLRTPPATAEELHAEVLAWLSR